MELVPLQLISWEQFKHRMNFMFVYNFLHEKHEVNTENCKKAEPNSIVTHKHTHLPATSGYHMCYEPHPSILGVITFILISDYPTSTTSVTQEFHLFWCPFPQLNYSSFSRQRDIFIIVFMYFLRI